MVLSMFAFVFTNFAQSRSQANNSSCFIFFVIISESIIHGANLPFSHLMLPPFDGNEWINEINCQLGHLVERKKYSDYSIYF